MFENQLVEWNFELFRQRIIWKIKINKNLSEEASRNGNSKDSIILHNKASVLGVCLVELNSFCEEMQDYEMEKTLKNNY